MDNRNISIFLVLRVILTFAVCAYHACDVRNFLQNEIFPIQIINKFHLAVDGHLIISGWLNAQSSDSLFQKLGFKQGTLEYGKKRIIRIIPVYYFMLAACHFCSGWYHFKVCDYVRLGNNALFIQNFFTHPNGRTNLCFTASWSIALQMHLFIMTPLVIYAFQKSVKFGHILCISLIVASLIFRY